MEHPIALPDRLVLASSSPRRRELLIGAGYEFDLIEPDGSVEQVDSSGQLPRQLVARLAAAKAANVATRLKTGIVLAADTVAEAHGEILGKPESSGHAKAMLEKLGGTTHYVHTGVCIWVRPHDRVLVEVATTQLVMDRLDAGQINEYLDSEAWRGKAGAFGFQDDLPWVRIIEGSPTNVVGLPLELLARMFAEIK